MSSEAAVEVHRLSKVFKLGRTGRTNSIPTILRQTIRDPRGRNRQRERLRALDDISFDVEPGEVVGVIGKNGAGKSTLLKILSRITFPSEGYVELVGRVGSLLEVGTGFHPELTGIENVYLNGTILGMSKQEIDSRLEEIVDFADVHRFLDTPVKRYSSGMRVRLAFAVAAHLEPEILIIDEVLSVGDAGFQAKCIEKMRSIASEDGRTVLYVSHNLVSVEHLCPRALLLVDGQLAFDGATADTVTKYLNTFPQAHRARERGIFDLESADRSDTNHAVVFKQLTFRPGGGAPSEIVRMGERLQVEIDVDGLDAMPDSVLKVTIGTSLNERVCRLSSMMRRPAAASPRCEREQVILEIPSMPLTPGEYYLDLHVQDRDTTGTVDEVHRAAEFTVVSADVLGSGFQFTTGDGDFFFPWDWEVRPRTVNPNAL